MCLCTGQLSAASALFARLKSSCANLFGRATVVGCWRFDCARQRASRLCLARAIGESHDLENNYRQVKEKVVESLSSCKLGSASPVSLFFQSDQRAAAAVAAAAAASVLLACKFYDLSFD